MSAEIPTGYRLPLVEEGTWRLPEPTMDAISGDVAADIGDDSTPAGAAVSNLVVEGISDPESAIGASLSATIDTVATESASDENTGFGQFLSSRLAPAAPRSLAMSGPKRLGRAPAAEIATTPLFLKSQSALNNLYWPQIIDLRGMGISVAGTPRDWAMVYSSDHQGGAGAGCAIAFAPEGADPRVAASWTEHAVLINTTNGGSNPETPRLFFDEKASKWLLFYSTSAPYTTGQHTRIFSSDVVQGPYTDTGKHIALAANDVGRFPADGDTTYLNPQRLGDIWVGNSIVGGTDYGFNGQWRSNNGLDWFLDPRILAWESHLFPDSATTLGGIGVTAGTVLVQFGGVIYGICASSTPASGATQSVSRRWLGRLTNDLRAWDGPPSEITYTVQSWMNGGSFTPLSVFEYGGELYAPFTSLGSMSIGLGRLEF